METRQKIAKKVQRSMTSRNLIVCSIEESKDIDELTLDELQSSLLVHEQKLNQQEKEKQTLLTSTNSLSSTLNKTNYNETKGQ